MEMPLGNRSKKGTNPGPHSRESAISILPGAGRTTQQPPPPPAGREPRTNPHRRREGGGRRRGGGCAWPQQPSKSNSPNGAAPDCFLANMHPPPATAPQSGKRRQGPDLAQLQHLPLLLSERGRGTTPRARGGSRRECAAPGTAAPPSATIAAPPARMRGLRGLLRAPPGSGHRHQEQQPRPPLRSAGCRRGREPGAAAAPGAERSRAAPRARPAPPVSPPPRARLLPRRAAASASTYALAAGSGARLVRKLPPRKRGASPRAFHFWFSRQQQKGEEAAGCWGAK
ncbi:Hypothetical predicted protein [Marmota monax]|uniref:Uncharacterized protein n=1 Tax=Marmota monax TaxID=9995 RepID=A0A5E4A5A1_MARMO|nr:Hypothetical predicted protein [Marmota monax]